MRKCGVLVRAGIVGLTMLAVEARSAEPDDQCVAQLIEQLGSPQFIERQLATESLSSMGLEVVGRVKLAMDARDPEVRYRTGRYYGPSVI